MHETPVLMAAARSRRPGAFAGSATPQRNPFLPGNEAQTPPELFAIRPDGGAANGPGWQLRVIPNRFAALDPDADPADSDAAGGDHEVIIETPEPDLRFHQYDDVTMQRVLTAWQRRAGHHLADPRVQSVLILRNHGPLSGGSLMHPHSQLFASRRALEELAPASTFQPENPLEPSRWIGESGHFVAWCPRAARLAFELAISPRAYHRPFPLLDEAVLQDLGGLLRRITAALSQLHGEHSWNLLLALHRRALANGDPWHIGIFPRLGAAGILEIAAGFFINPITPELAAAELRRAFSETQE